MAAPTPPEPTPARYRPLSARRRWLIALLAAATAIAVVLTLLHPPGGVQRKRPPPAPCAPGQQIGCVGGKAEVIVPASAGPAASAR